jgi:hypothetical protein
MTTHTADQAALGGDDSEPRAPRRGSSFIVLLVLADVTLTAVLFGGRTWWLAAAAWGMCLLMLFQVLRPRRV